MTQTLSLFLCVVDLYFPLLGFARAFELEFSLILELWTQLHDYYACLVVMRVQNQTILCPSRHPWRASLMTCFPAFPQTFPNVVSEEGDLTLFFFRKKNRSVAGKTKLMKSESPTSSLTLVRPESNALEVRKRGAEESLRNKVCCFDFRNLSNNSWSCIACRT